MSLTATDLFCGAGGSGLGAHAAGFDLVIAANHWAKAIETHAANFPSTEHDCADISQVNPRRYPTTDVLWASPECTNHSQAKGKSRSLQQPDIFGETLPDEAAERSRATMWDVPRFAEHHAYRAIVVENVVEAAKWVQFPAWIYAMELLGYEHQLVFLNSMHAPAIDAPRAPQSRDRLYVVFNRKGSVKPDVEPRPIAHCEPCGQDVHAVQWFKKPERWGRYRAQYLYRCPRQECRHSVVEPYALPAASAIDWTMPGSRIGDRAKPLSSKTILRIEAGLKKYGSSMVVPSGGTWNETAQPASWPMRTRTARESDALVVPVEGREGKQARSASEPMRTMTARAETALVVPYHASTITTKGHQSLVSIEHDVNDCNFRMLEPHEIQAAMAFESGYTVLGTRRERVRQLGSGVTPPAAEFLLRAVAQSLEGAA